MISMRITMCSTSDFYMYSYNRNMHASYVRPAQVLLMRPDIHLCWQIKVPFSFVVPTVCGRLFHVESSTLSIVLGQGTILPDQSSSALTSGPSLVLEFTTYKCSIRLESDRELLIPHWQDHKHRNKTADIAMLP